MVDLSKFSADVRNRIENIMATKVEDGGGKSANEIDSQKEYNELGKLLSGDGKVTGKQREIVEGMLTDYEDKFMVRDEVKQRVADIVKNGDEKHADDNAEIKDLKNYKKTKGLSKEEKAYIQRVIDGKEVEQAGDVKETKTTETNIKETEKNEFKTAPKESEEGGGEDVGKPVKNETKPTPPKGKTPNEPEPMPGGNPIPVPVPLPVPVPVENNIDNSNRSKQGGLKNVNVNGNGNTVIINGETKTERTKEPSVTNKPEETPSTKPNKPTAQELEVLANQIFDAIDGLGTKNEQLKTALKQITKDNIIELLDTYNAKHPDMFASILDDLSGYDYTIAVEILKDALVQRGGGDSVLTQHAGAIENELNSTWRSDDIIVSHLNDMVIHIKSKEREG